MDNRYTTPAEPKNMGACPYCRSATLPSDTICYSCGRVLPKGDRGSYRLEQQFSKKKGNKDTTYLMANKPSRRGVVQTHTGRQRNIMKRRKNRFRSFAMLGLVAFVLLSPQAQEAVFGEFGGVEEFLQSQLAPYHVYPNEASYTLSKISDVSATGQASATENILIPPTVYSSLSGAAQFMYSDSTESAAPTALQQTLQITLSIDGQDINIPIDGMPDRPYSNAITTANGHKVWWPDVGSGDEQCPMAKCVKVRSNFQNGGSVRYDFNIQIQSTSYSWWDDGRVKETIVGKSDGINAENSGTFADLAYRGNGVRQAEFGGDYWYDRGGSAGYAINAQDAIVMATADAISSSLPEGSSDNAYAFSRATFDYLHTFITYDREAPAPARSGPACLAAGTGDCDEQTNAFFSLLRTRGIPGWYAFGVLGDPFFSNDGWEAHAWGYIQLPLKDSWCEERNIVLQTCFVEAQVDVVNNKWLLSTPTAYLDWIEEADGTGGMVYDYYHPVGIETYSGSSIDRLRGFETQGSVELNGGTYKVKKYAEAF
ncbi:MAG TPA: transglutaminase domain-containing protein [Candidatus Poseidoniales archaeon]|nr:MAG TPA: transglutaminase domain-containing protein [Candidatus Poseidoniales archaeon]